MVDFGNLVAVGKLAQALGQRVGAVWMVRGGSSPPHPQFGAVYGARSFVLIKHLHRQAKACILMQSTPDYLRYYTPYYPLPFDHPSTGGQ